MSTFVVTTDLIDVRQLGGILVQFILYLLAEYVSFAISHYKNETTTLAKLVSFKTTTFGKPGLLELI